MTTKTTAKHTPGPWLIEGGKSKEGDLFIWQDGDYEGGHGIARVFKAAECHGGTVEANARLIAQAPALLALCRGYRNTYPLDEYVSKADEIIARAEGR